MEKVHAAWRCISVTDQPKKYLLSRLVDFLSVYGHYMLLAILPTGHPRYPRYPKCIVTVLYQLYHYIYIVDGFSSPCHMACSSFVDHKTEEETRRGFSNRSWRCS
jgi:hypothetical protein